MSGSFLIKIMDETLNTVTLIVVMYIMYGEMSIADFLYN